MLFLLQYGTALVGLLAALSVWFARRLSWSALPSSARIWTSVGLVIALGISILFNVSSAFPWWVPPLDEDGYLVLGLFRFIAPLLLCAIALLFLIPPARGVGPRGAAELAPRTLLTFSSRPWLASAVGVVTGVIIVTVLAGMASSPDEAGRYLVYSVEASATTNASTTIYGWFYSGPCLIAIAVIVVLVLVELTVISRPPLAIDRDNDVATRTARVRNVLAVSTGGLLLHLGAVLQSLHGTSSLRLGMDAGAPGWAELGTSFAAIGPFLLVAGYVSVVAGLAMWWMVLVSALTARTREPVDAVLA